jgi:hypothetical protein
MPLVGFESTILVLERVKTVHALDRAAIVIGKLKLYMSMCQQDSNMRTSATPILRSGCFVAIHF